MYLSEISVKRPVLASVFSLLLVIFGIISFFKLPLREYPDVNPPIVSIQTTYTGASADIIETRVTQLIEGIISGIEGIRTIESESEDGRSNITIEFNIDRDVDAAAADVRDRVARIVNNLPDEADPPEITKLDNNTQEVMWLRLTSDIYNQMELTDYADRFLIDRLSTVDGVARVRIGGERRYAMRIWLDRKALSARGVTVDDVAQALRRENIELPAGRLESYKREFTLRVERLYESAEDFGKLVIKRGDDGYLIRLRDVADVEVAPEDKRTELRSVGLPAIGLGIAKQSRANTLVVTRGIRKEMEEIIPSLPDGITLKVAYDSSLFVESAIDEVYSTLFMTIALVITVIFLFLGNVRATLVPAVTIPISLISAFIVLYLFDFSVNLLTLLALVLSIGLVVDDAIVVLENIFKKIESGMPPLAAAFKGSNEVGFAVIATTLVLLAAFIPISFLEGDEGRLFTEFAITMAAAVAFSSLVALTLCPMLCSKILKQESAKKGFSQKVEAVMERVMVPYKKALDLALAHKSYIILSTVIAIPAIYFLFTIIPGEFEPTEDRGVFFTVIQGPEGSSLEYMKQKTRTLEKDLGVLIDSGEANQTLVILPGIQGSTGSVNSGIGIILLEPWDKRERTAQEIVKGIQPKLFSYPGILAFPILPKGLTQGRLSQPIQFVIQGSSYEELAEWRDKFLEKLKAYPGIVNVDFDYKETKPQYLIDIDRDRAASLGVSNQAIGTTLETALGSRQVTTYIDKGEEYDVILQMDDKGRQTTRDLNNIYVRSSTTNELIPLSNLVTLKETSDAASLNRFNRLRAVTISGTPAPGYTQGEVLAKLEEISKEVLPKTAKIDYKGESRTFKETSASFYLIFALALIVVYLVLAGQFESFIHPFVILTVVPLSIFGALAGLFLFGVTMNIYSQIGILMLVGLSSKNSILIVEFANQLRDQGMEFFKALEQACLLRLRPILMTALSTAIGALPLVLATGAGAESRLSLGVVVFVGVLFSTFLTLFVVPVFYALMAQNTDSPEANTRLLEKQLKEGK